ncbi:methionine biosynthesis protein MetW [Alkalilimnicola ehrlichii]|uniref:Methionine biosynthesis protein MetW n=1 Tax=Alkalilimnicola ehrlichii (strain ATCC BAA-1101 / DSM 17681 / MLHE-1) TaxID=187272 RepID=Q0ABU5_ALKEH|nr:methionine biosynthesis protein MetW [Alkalilimnicola ehrlichii]ABI55692.1 methionine biosynthesis protein MetW [Alkalilimnicola ehrlichii MLHE-1]
MSALRPDLAIISDWIAPGSRILDLGCGDGTLLAHLAGEREVTGYGLEIEPRKIVACLEKGVSVIQADLDKGLSDFKDQAFDYVLMTQTLQAVHYPDELLQEMLRVGREGIVTFPNFGNWRMRLYLGFHGRMPISRTLPHTWYNTPNIHLCTVRDFEALCAERGIEILERHVTDQAMHDNALMRQFPNLLGDVALYRIRQAAR